MRTLVFLLLCSAPASAGFAVAIETRVQVLSQDGYGLDGWRETVQVAGDGAGPLDLAVIPAQVVEGDALSFNIIAGARLYSSATFVQYSYQATITYSVERGEVDWGGGVLSDLTYIPPAHPLVVDGLRYDLAVSLLGRPSGIPGFLVGGYEVTASPFVPSVPPVPEPASLALMGIGLAGLATLRKLAVAADSAGTPAS